MPYSPESRRNDKLLKIYFFLVLYTIQSYSKRQPKTNRKKSEKCLPNPNKSILKIKGT